MNSIEVPSPAVPQIVSELNAIIQSKIAPGSEGLFVPFNFEMCLFHTKNTLLPKVLLCS